MKSILFLLLLAGCSVDNTPCSVDVGQIYEASMQCVGMYAEPPHTEFIDFDTLNLGKVWGVYHVPSKTVFINTGEMGLGFEHTCSTQEQTLRHENIHHILRENGISDYDFQFFELCGVGVNT